MVARNSGRKNNLALTILLGKIKNLPGNFLLPFFRSQLIETVEEESAFAVFQIFFHSLFRFRKFIFLENFVNICSQVFSAVREFTQRNWNRHADPLLLFDILLARAEGEVSQQGGFAGSGIADDHQPVIILKRPVRFNCFFSFYAFFFLSLHKYFFKYLLLSLDWNLPLLFTLSQLQRYVNILQGNRLLLPDRSDILYRLKILPHRVEISVEVVIFFPECGGQILL